MLVLVDTNVLLRLVKSDDALHTTALAALDRLVDLSATVVIVPQCCYEFYVVATRPVDVNGLGLDPETADAKLDEFLGFLSLLRDERTILESWRDLVRTYRVRGKTAHDARLVAAMRRHRIDHVLTFNTSDFKRYSAFLTVLDPGRLAVP
jgi:predicted nucleic acid-binding protein